jgi:hypothetical protein
MMGTAKTMKGQASVENMAMVSSLLVIMIPLIIFIMSVSSTHNASFYQRQLYEDADVLKRNIEEAYAFCPGGRNISVYYPTALDNVTFIGVGDRAMLITNYTLDGRDYSFSTPVNTVNSNAHDYPGLDNGKISINAVSGNTNMVSKGGMATITIRCSIADRSLPGQRIMLEIEDLRRAG